MELIYHIPSIVAILLIILTFIILHRRGYGVTFSLLVSNFLVFAIYVIFPNELNIDLAFSPIYILYYPEKVYTIVTSMFIHADLSHILGNMITLFFIGIPFERRIGWKKFSIIYFLSGIGGALLFSIINPKPILLVGASGAIFGILGAFAFAYPLDEIIMPLPVFFVAFLTKMKVIHAAILFGLLEIGFTFFSPNYGNIAHIAHIGGLFTGISLSYLILKERRRRIRVMEYRDIYELSNDKNRELIDKIKYENIPEIKREWMNKLVRESRCPYCGEKLRVSYDGIVCKKCGIIFR